jgi:outer membrane receptor for ferrienterochelin and colicin
MKKTQRFIICLTLFFTVLIGPLSAATVRGYVRNYNGNTPIKEALVAIEPQKGTKYSAQTMTDLDGFFEFKEVPEGTYKIAGMKECFYSNSLFDFFVSDDGIYNVKVKLIENPNGTDDMSYCFMIGGIEVEAAGRDILPEEIATTRKIDSGEIDHLQASNLGDVLTLVPGVEKSGQMGLAKQQNVGLRKVKRSDSGLYGFESFGTSIVIDGNEISGDMQAAGYVSGSVDQSGTDLRTIPADNIASVEVITGIPSVEYGNFTDGIVKVETKKGVVNRRFKAKVNPDTKGFSYNGGYKFNDENTVFDYHVNYSYSERDIREIGDEYQRLYGSANLSRNFMDNKLNSRLGFTYTRIFDDKEPNDEYKMQNTNRGYRTSGKLDLKYKTDNNVKYELFAGLDYKNQDEVKQKMVTDQLFLPLDTDVSSIDQSYCTISTIYDTVYVNESDTIDYVDSTMMVYPYNASISQNGEEWDISFKLKRKSTFELGKTKNKILYGFETDYEKNTGEGVVLDSVFNYYGKESSKRSRSFDEFPANLKFALYAEDQISFDLFNRKMDVLIGLRYDLINPEKFRVSFDEGFSLFDAKQGDFFSPRFNIKYQLSDDLALRMGTGQSVKSVSLTQIYKIPKHIAYLDTSTDKVAEKILYQVNEDLKSYVSQKAEASLDWRINDVLGASMTGYYSHTTNRPNGVTYPEGYDVNPDTINIEYSYSIYENAGWVDDYGAELTFRTKRIRDIKYALNATYRFSRSGSTSLVYDPDFQATSSNWVLWYPARINWQSKLILDAQLSYLNQRFGLWVTVDLQYTPFYQRQYIYESEGVESLNEYGDSYTKYQGMSYWYDAEINNYTGQWLMNLRLSKSLGNNAEVSLYINNFFDNRATYISPYSGSQFNLNSPIYYGLEMSVKL